MRTSSDRRSLRAILPRASIPYLQNPSLESGSVLLEPEPRQETHRCAVVWRSCWPSSWAAQAALAGDDRQSQRAMSDQQAYDPPIAKASDEGLKAIRSFRVPAGLKVELFAAEPLLANPVAFLHR